MLIDYRVPRKAGGPVMGLLTAAESDGSTMLIVLCIKIVLEYNTQCVWKINDLMGESSRMVSEKGRMVSACVIPIRDSGSWR